MTLREQIDPPAGDSTERPCRRCGRDLEDSGACGICDGPALSAAAWRARAYAQCRCSDEQPVSYREALAVGWLSQTLATMEAERDSLLRQVERMRGDGPPPIDISCPF